MIGTTSNPFGRPSAAAARALEQHAAERLVHGAVVQVLRIPRREADERDIPFVYEHGTFPKIVPDVFLYPIRRNAPVHWRRGDRPDRAHCGAAASVRYGAQLIRGNPQE